MTTAESGFGHRIWSVGTERVILRKSPILYSTRTGLKAEVDGWILPRGFVASLLIGALKGLETLPNAPHEAGQLDFQPPKELDRVAVRLALPLFCLGLRLTY